MTPATTPPHIPTRTPRRRALSALAIAALLPLAGCSDASYTKVTNTDLPPGFYLSGEFVELGPRDPNAPEPEWIDPCNEIPEDILEDIGMKRGTRSGGTIFGVNGCSGPVSEKLTNNIEYPTNQIIQGILSGPAPNSQFLTHSDFASNGFLEDIPGVITLKNDEGCGLSTDTERGLFVIYIDDIGENLTGDEACEIATKSFYRLYNQLREQK
ncbi:DUF3558 domain-containing protein [Corynebacterium uterequi]|uniref:DUF3558 family protein n=1 Tax=Corynebacterium uterequi TaxID=1072256 RepID=A0A0G3HHG5_9CORY|nr:DUF3558 domain-containing protein [Corynebacterium uterequi]AKK11373.1 hypothetical protein CUTER_06920 [Corynebacterium uterequi]